MRKWSKMLCILVAMLVLLSVAPEVPALMVEEEAPVDVVLILDCSASLFYHDTQRLCLNACKSFVDQLPIQDVRVGVIGFGYGDDNPYPFSGKFSKQASAGMNMSMDAMYVHEIMPLTNLNTSEIREASKEIIEKAALTAWQRTVATERDGGQLFSPVVPAVAAAVDMLEKSGSAKENACIILISDGESYTNGGNYNHKEVGKLARDHGWPIYSIELNYANPHAQNVEKAQKLLDEICAASGDRNVAREYCEDPRAVHIALQRIFFDLWKYPEPIPENWPQVMELPAEFTFEVPVLTSEEMVNIFGNGVTRVTLTSPDPKDKPIVITGNFERDNFMAVVENDSYTSLKMICPKDGEWTCKIDGVGSAAVLVNNTDLQEMGLEIVSNPKAGGEALKKDDVIRIDAYFAYRDYKVQDNGVYEDTVNQARLEVQHESGRSKQYQMNADRQGYYCELSLNEFPAGTVSMRMVLENNMFRNGRKYTDYVTYTTKNMTLELTGSGPETLSGYVNSTFDRIDLNDIFRNPDGDAIAYDLKCEDRGITFDFGEENGYMTIDTGMNPGTYPVTILAKDPDMVQPLEYAITLNISNREPVTKEIPDMELWSDSYGFQKGKERKQAHINLDDYVTDPDEVKLTYAVSADGNVVKTVLSDNMLTLTPVEEGKATVTVTADDGVCDVTLRFDVNVVNGKAAFWRDNWIYFAIALVIMIVIVLVTILLIKNKRVKGRWEIIIDDNGQSGRIEQMDIAGYTASGKKGKFLLKDLLSELLSYTDYPLSSANVMGYFGGNGSEKIQLVGVIGKKGCSVVNIPGNSDVVTVTVNGVKAQKKAKVRNGILGIVVNNGDTGERLTITMRLI